MKVLRFVMLAAVSITAAKAEAVKGPAPDGQVTQSPHGKLSWECFDCHNTESWNSVKKPIAFRHETTGFPLIGAHDAVACGSCHKDLKFTHVGSACADCHTDIHRGQFGIACQNCHSPLSWKNQEDIFDLHASRGFPLVGIHSITDCAACHVNQQQNEFAGTPIECQGCHESNFRETDNPDHVLAGFASDCKQCHQPVAVSWIVTTFTHTPAFALHGAHARTDCRSCHAASYANTSAECFSCHEQDYNATVNPPHATFGFLTDCAVCHTDERWTGSTFDHVQASGYELRGAHVTILCMECHVNNQLNLPRECYACHQSEYDDTQSPAHLQNNFPQDCTQCHNESAWQPSTFDHAQTGFQLTGAHLTTACNDCHNDNYQGGTPSDCYSCHQNDYNGVSDPSHVQNNFSHDCTQCHSTTAWQPASFDHADTQFPLTGAHVSLQCIACHAGGYQNTPTDCYACHANDYNSVTDPNHVQNNFSHDCTECHNTTAWDPATFDHNNTQFPLTGAHVGVQCIACHASGYQNTPTDCYACHANDFNSVTDPNHVENNFSHDCTQCHNTTAWDPATFDHNNTQFPLTGAHVGLQCIACHANGYQNTPTDCIACHQTDFHDANDPDHEQNNFPQDCTQCHNTVAWQPSTFDHNNTQFPLTGAHVSLECIRCHASGYQDIPSDCYSCHADDYNNADDPDHVGNNFPHDCTICHNTSDWGGDVFNHDNTQFPLTGAHVNLQCIACHAGGYQNIPSECYACHQQDYDSVVDPNHIQDNFSQICTQCHTTAAWAPATYDHSLSQFPLTGAHLSLACLACHANGYDNTPSECFACHETDYNSVTDPNHVQNNFDHDCTLCHTTTAWQPANFDHNNTQFPLTGAHVGLECIACHANGYQNTPTECYACHESDYNSVPDPNHVQDNFSHECTQCHTTAAWVPATYDHNLSQFPLTGAHLSVPCNSCHANGFDNTPTECYACHINDYNNSSDPDHQAMGFPTECQQCHNTDAWQPANWDHDAQYFPIFTGRHQGRWSTCTDCHLNPNDFGAFECIFCHEHNQQDTDEEHSDVPGYQYNSLACYSCHPRGEG